MPRGIVGRAGNIFMRKLDGCRVTLGFFLTVVFLVGYALSNLAGVFGDPIRSDGVGYYAYLPSLILHGDPTYLKLSGSQYDGTIPGWTGISQVDGRYLNRYPPGLAILALPFFCAGHLATLIMQSPPGAPPGRIYGFNYPADGFSFFYQHAAGLGGMTLLLTGLVLLHGLLLRYYSRATSTLTVLLLVFGTNLLNYGTGESFCAHNGVFLLVVFVMRALPNWFNHPAWVTSLWLGVLVGLLALVRSTTLLILPACMLFGVCRFHDGVERVRLLCSRLHFLVIAGCVIGLLLGMQLVMNYLACGEWVFNGYARQGFGFYWTEPRWLEVLFSPRHGALLHAPILILALVGLFFLRGRAAAWRIPAWIFVVGTLYIIAAWWNWWFGGAFGHRGLIDAYPFLALGIAQALSMLRDDSRSAWFTRAVWTFILLCLLWNLFLMKMYYTRELPIEGFDADALYDVFWWRWQWLRGFFFADTWCNPRLSEMECLFLFTNSPK